MAEQNGKGRRGVQNRGGLKFSNHMPSSFMSPLNTGEIRVPSMIDPPTMGGHNWGSAVMTNTQTFGAGTFPAVLPSNEQQEGLLFPPPPPPMFNTRTSWDFNTKHHRMMRWFQVIEGWCAEVGVQDCNRAIVAPPPRPPPFLGASPVQGAVITPFNAEFWSKKCHEWWAYTSRMFDKLRLDPLWDVSHVSRGAAIMADKDFVLANCVCDELPSASDAVNNGDDGGDAGGYGGITVVSSDSPQKVRRGMHHE